MKIEYQVLFLKIGYFLLISIGRDYDQPIPTNFFKEIEKIERDAHG
jgi:hypothetical protein